jgi:hypothetical protein
VIQAGRSLVQVLDEVDFFYLPNPSSHTMALGSTQPLTKMSTRNLPGGKTRPAHRADNLAAIYGPMSENVAALTFWNPKVLHGLYRYNLPFLPFKLGIILGCWNLPIKLNGITSYKLDLAYFVVFFTIALCRSAI